MTPEGTREPRNVGEDVLVVMTLFDSERRGVNPLDQVSSSFRQSTCETGFDRLSILLYDNSPAPTLDVCMQRPDVIYEHHPENGGTRAAFTRAIEMASERGFRWILLLDQDSRLPRGYLSALLSRAAGVNRPAAIVPLVMDGERLVSPCCVTAWGRIKPVHPSGSQATGGRLSAIASGALLSVEHCRRLPLPPADLWLDFLDHWIFRSLAASGGVICSVDVRIEHRLSVSRPRDMSPERIRNILRAESIFYREEPTRARLGLRTRWIVRALRYSLQSCSHGWIILRWALGLDRKRDPVA